MSAIHLILAISIAGPIIGSAIGVLHRPSHRVIHHMLAFAGGVMMTISILELIPHSIELSSIYVTSLGILVGALIMLGLEKSIPHFHPDCRNKQDRKLKKTSLYLILGILIHNFPEGIAIATGVAADTNTSLAIAIGIAIHNIPEGICTSAPYYYCTKKRLRSFLISSSTAIPIAVGFIFSYLLFQNLSSQVIGAITAITAGLMIYISSDELIPTSCNKNEQHWNPGNIFSLIAGVIFVVILSSI